MLKCARLRTCSASASRRLSVPLVNGTCRRSVHAGSVERPPLPGARKRACTSAASWAAPKHPLPEVTFHLRSAPRALAIFSMSRRGFMPYSSPSLRAVNMDRCGLVGYLAVARRAPKIVAALRRQSDYSDLEGRPFRGLYAFEIPSAALTELLRAPEAGRPRLLGSRPSIRSALLTQSRRAGYFAGKRRMPPGEDKPTLLPYRPLGNSSSRAMTCTP